MPGLDRMVDAYVEVYSQLTSLLRRAARKA